MGLLWDDRGWNDYLYWQTQVYRKDDNSIIIASCKGHYDE